MFETANYVEAGFWILIGAVFCAESVHRGGQRRRRCLLIAGTFIVFGISDVIEAQTGAWWRPWWLLVWKGLCVFVLASSFYSHIKAKKREGI